MYYGCAVRTTAQPGQYAVTVFSVIASGVTFAETFGSE